MVEVAVASGKRKSAVARAYVKSGKGVVKINKLSLQAYPEYIRSILAEPLQIAEKYKDKIDVRVIASGGGPISQAEAARTAIAKALVAFSGDDELKKMFMEYDRTLLVSDIRRKEPKKQLGRGARKKRQKSYR
ncbi:MAG: 30S ribosomal protein S9 [Thermoplasmata archaeon]|nr:MAG: 30S ribosomal protein S9 [Thermoplasmata archaeon]KAA0009007.1 MAG: 30S ribosomal protein S9 [Thermoplasmata archaeon]MCD6572620.1 30S ribosomal protein S9 [Thermoplasmata archaeon]